MRAKIQKFLNSSKAYPVLTIFAAGLYPLFYLYDRNFNLVNSWPQFLYLVFVFFIIPLIVYLVITLTFRKINGLGRFQPYVLSILNCVSFAFFIAWITQGIHKKKILLAVIIVAFFIGFLIYKHIKKIVVLQLLLSCYLLVKISFGLYYYLNYSYDWQDISDEIEAVKFTKTPNVYYLQPDGYLNFSEINRGYYNYDNSEMRSFFETNNFKLYDDFRSNYTSTLTSNSSMFSMKHHYYNFNAEQSVTNNARKIIVGKNAVIDIFKNNGYKTHLILDHTYLILNRPNLKYDTCNIDYGDLPFLSNGFDEEENTLKDLSKILDNSVTYNNFYFVRQPSPGHINISKSTSFGAEQEREIYLANLEKSNMWLKEITDLITAKDSNALIIISSDHGGYVGYDYTYQIKSKTTDADLIKSSFSSLLAIRWPNNDNPDYTSELKTSVNLFRVVFSYLSENNAYLSSLEADDSYSVITDGAATGIYKTMDAKGNAVFKSISN